VIPVPVVTDREFVWGTDKSLPPREVCCTLERWAAPGTQLARDIACGGVLCRDMRVKPGLDEWAVWRAIMAHLRSRTSHLHTITGVGMMLEEWTERT